MRTTIQKPAERQLIDMRVKEICAKAIKEAPVLKYKSPLLERTERFLQRYRAL